MSLETSASTDGTKTNVLSRLTVTLNSDVWQVGWGDDVNIKKTFQRDRKKHASSIIVCLLGRKIKCMFSKFTTRQKRHSVWNEKDRAMPSRGHKKEQLRKEMRKNSEDILFLSWVFLAELRKVRLYRETRRREAATPDRTYSSPPFSPCAPFCTAPWVWLSGPGPHPRPQWDLARPSLHRGEQNQTETLLRNCPVWGPRGLYYAASL